MSLPFLLQGLDRRSRLFVACALLLLSGSSTGCVTEMVANAGIRAAHKASRSTNTIHDFEVGRSVIQGGIGQLEGFHSLTPGNETGLVLLTKAWTAVGLAYLEDDYEEAYQVGDTKLAEYHRRRQRAALARARFYAIEALEHHADGFQPARRNGITIRDWVRENFDSRDEAELLLWAGVAWVAHAASVARDDPGTVGELYVGVELVTRSVQLDPARDHAMGETILGAYHARSALAELGDSKKHFDRALALNEGRFLMTKVFLAQRYFCLRGDRASYERTLNEVLSESDPLPEARLQNAIAKRLAFRYLGSPVWQEECGFSR